MNEFLSFIIFIFIIGFVIYLSDIDVIKADINKMSKYNGSVVVNKYEEDMIRSNILTVKTDSSYKDLSVHDIVFQQFSVGDTVNINTK